MWQWYIEYILSLYVYNNRRRFFYMDTKCKRRRRRKKQTLVFKLVSYLPTFCAWIYPDTYDEQLML